MDYVMHKEAQENRSLKKILLLEDDLTFLGMLKQVVESRGWLAECSSDVSSAIWKLSQDHFDLIVSDYEIGYASTGLELLEHWEMNGYRIPFIIMSGIVSDEILSVMRTKNIFAFLHKPFSIRTFINTCQNAMNENMAHPPSEDHP